MEINLKNLYPNCYVEDNFIDVSEEVMAVFENYRLKERRNRRMISRYKAYYSVDDEDVMSHTLYNEPSAEDAFIKNEISNLLYKALKNLTDTQYCRVYKYIYLKMTLKDIVESENKSIASVKESIDRAIKQLSKYLEENSEAAR